MVCLDKSRQKHLKEFNIVYTTTMTTQGVPEKHIKLKAFSFALRERKGLYYSSASKSHFHKNTNLWQ